MEIKSIKRYRFVEESTLHEYTEENSQVCNIRSFTRVTIFAVDNCQRPHELRVKKYEEVSVLFNFFLFPDFSKIDLFKVNQTYTS